MWVILSNYKSWDDPPSICSECMQSVTILRLVYKFKPCKCRYYVNLPYIRMIWVNHLLIFILRLEGFQMAFLWLINGVIQNTYKSWDDPPCRVLPNEGKFIQFVQPFMGCFTNEWCLSKVDQIKPGNYRQRGLPKK